MSVLLKSSRLQNFIKCREQLNFQTYHVSSTPCSRQRWYYCGSGIGYPL